MRGNEKRWKTMTALGLVLMGLGCAMLILLLVTGCGGPKPFDPEKTAEALNGSEAFSEPLEEMARKVYTRWYNVDDAKLERGVVYASTGGTAEEFAVLVFVDETSAQAGEEALKAHVADQLEANRGYRELDVPKLESARVERRETTVLLLVANDYAAADKVLR